MEVIVEKIIDETLFKKDSWFKKLLRRIKCKSSCCMGSSCSLEPEEEIKEKHRQKQEIMDFVYELKRKSIEENSNGNGEKAQQSVNSIVSHI